MADRWVEQNLSIEQQVIEVYVAAFKRAPDAAGLTYWVHQVNTGVLTIEQVAQSFFDQPEMQARYPSSTTTAAFVAAVYDNALGRVPDAEGLNYWVTQLDRGAVAPDLFILSILRGAYDDPRVSPPTLDDAWLTHQRIAAEYYAHSTAATATQFDPVAAAAVLAVVTAEESSLAAAQTLTDQYSLSGGLPDQTFTLTTSDVRTVDGSDFAGDLKLGITLHEDSIDRYLDSATGPVEFNYTASAQDDIFTIEVDDDLSEDPDFAMNAQMGEGDDRLNVAVNTASAIAVDGGAGNNVIAVGNSRGTDSNNTFAAFSNFQTYEVEGDNADATIDNFAGTAHDFTDMPGVADMVIATFANAGTALIDLEDGATVTVSGKNQTLGNNSNADQAFGQIRILGADGATQDVTLHNTARIDAELTIAEWVIDDEANDNASAVRTLNLASTGRRDTTNGVDILEAPLVNTFNFTGTQDLTIDWLVAAANSTDRAADREDLVVDGSELTGDLFLGLDGPMIGRLNDEDADTTVTLTGAEGDSDELAFIGPVETTPATTIAGFETITLGHGEASGGTFDATRVSDVELYEVTQLDAPLEINNMDGEETVAINVEEDIADRDITLAAHSPGTTNALTVEFYAESPDDFQNFGSPLSIQDFRTVTLDLGGSSAADWDYALHLVFLDGEGLALGEVGFEADEVYARTLTVIGGVDGDEVDDESTDSVDLGLLSTALTQVDVSHFNGDVIAAWADAEGSNAIVYGNSYDLTWDISATPSEFITTFRFTEEANDEFAIWQIDGFQAFGDDNVSLDNLTVLDLRDLGVEGWVDIRIQVGNVFWASLTASQRADYIASGDADLLSSDANVVITSNDDLDFHIVLTGTAVGAITNENFVFA